jgi:uncharacterized membrane protein
LLAPYLSDSKTNLDVGGSMSRKLTSNLHNYTNIMNYIMITVENQEIALSDVAFSDIKGEVIKSFPDQVAEQVRLIKQIANGEVVVPDDDDDPMLQ